MNANPLDPVKINYSPEQKHMTRAREFQGIPGIEQASNGRLWATWYSGGVAEGPDNFTLLVTSNDNGKNWTEPVLVIDPPGNVRAFDPVIWHDPMGWLWLFWSQSYSPEDEVIVDGQVGVWGIYTEDSTVEKPVFSEPVRIANGVMMNKPTVLSNGEWAFPTALWAYRGPFLEELKDERFSNITISENNGKTFYRRGGADIPERCFDEHMIVEKEDGRLWILTRTLYGIGQSFSEDKGKTWSPGEDSKIGGPNSRFFIRRLSSGNILLVNHADIPSEEAYKRFKGGDTWRRRSHLTAFISDDNGKSWKGGLVIDEREGVSYPDGIEGKDGMIRIIYDYERHKEGEILTASFREEDVLAGKVVSKDAAFKIMINKTGGLKK